MSGATNDTTSVTSSLFTVLPFRSYLAQPPSFEASQKQTIAFYLLDFCSPDEYLRLACTSLGWQDLCNLKVHMSFVHQAARPWRSLTTSGTGGKINRTSASAVQLDHYAHWSTKGYAWGAGSVRWKQLRERLAEAPPSERQGIRSGSDQLSLSKFYGTFERLPGVPVIFTDLTTNWSSTPISAGKQTTSSLAKEQNDPVPVPDVTKEWSLPNFLARFSTQWFRFDDLHGEEIKLLDYYVYTLITRDDSPLALYDSQFGEPEEEEGEGEGEEEGEEEGENEPEQKQEKGTEDTGQMDTQKEPMTNLVSEYTVPKYFKDDMFSIVTSTDIDSVATVSNNDNDQRPPFRWVLIGPARSGTGLHIDPLWTSAWVTLLHGMKRWCMFPPDTPPDSIGFAAHGPTKLEAVEWFDTYSTRIHSIKGVVEIVQQEGETVFVPAGWYHVVVNLTTTVSITHNYASPYGGPQGIQQIWREIVCDEPEFAQRWYREMLVLHLNGSGHQESNANDAGENDRGNESASESARPGTSRWVQSSNVVQHVQEAHAILLKERRCDWNLEDSWDGLKLNDLFSTGQSSGESSGDTKEREKVQQLVLSLEKNGEIVKVLLNKEDRKRMKQEETERLERIRKKQEEERKEDKGAAGATGSKSKSTKSTKSTKSNEEKTSSLATTDDGDSDDDTTTIMHLLYKVAFTSIVVLDGSNRVFLIKHRSGEWTPPGGQIEKNENSLEASKREYQEETGVSIDTLLSKGLLESMGVFLYFHPESANRFGKKERKHVSTG